MNRITETLGMIKHQLGINLQLCDRFTGVRYHGGKPYFNAVIDTRVSESRVFDKLKRFSEKYKSIKVEPNGINRIAIFY